MPTLCTRGEIPTVALLAAAAFGLAGEHASNTYLFNIGGLDPIRHLFGDLLLRLNDHFISDDIDNVIERDTPQDTLLEADDILVSLADRRHQNSVDRTAVILSDNHILRDIHQAACEIPRVSRLKSSIG